MRSGDDGTGGVKKNCEEEREGAESWGGPSRLLQLKKPCGSGTR